MAQLRVRAAGDRKAEKEAELSGTLGRRLAILLLVAVAFVIPSVMGAGQGSILTFAGLFDIPMLDPHATDSGTAASIHMQICENLTRFKPGTGEVVPQLAESWEISDDLTTYTFYLRQGVTFTDGAPFNAEAVKTNIERVLALGKGPSTRLREVDRVEVVDDYTVRIILKAPSITFLYSLNARAGLHIISPKAIEDNATSSDPWAADWFSTNLVGTGPYKLVEWVAGDRVILTKNEDYWGGWEGNHIDTIVRRTVPEYTTRKLLLETGEADMIDYLQPDDAENLRRIPGVHVEELPTINVGWFMFLFMDDIMWNIDLRKALSWAFPYEEANQVAGWGSSPLQGPMPDGVPGHNGDLFTYTTDLSKAAEHLAAAGYEPGELTLTLMDYSTDRNRRWFEVFYSNLQQIGVNLERDEMVWGQFSPWMASADKDKGHMGVIVHWPDFPEPSSYLTLYFKGTEDDPPALPRDFYSQQLNWWLDQAAMSKDSDRRAYYYGLAQEYIVDQALGIWGVHFYDAIAVRDHVKGFVFTPANFGVYDFYSMYIEE